MAEGNDYIDDEYKSGIAANEVTDKNSTTQDELHTDLATKDTAGVIATETAEKDSNVEVPTQAQVEQGVPQAPTLSELTSPENSLIQATIQYYSHGFDFLTRTTRSDFWWSTLGNLLIGAILSMFIGIGIGIASVGAETFGGFIIVLGLFLFLMWAILNIIPHLARSVRRLRDVGLSPYLGFIWLLNGISDLFFFIMALIPTSTIAKDTPRQTEVAPKNTIRNWIIYIVISVIVVGLLVAAIAALGLTADDNSGQLIDQIDNFSSY